MPSIASTGAFLRRPGYASALVEIVLRESVDVYVPVCSPASAVDDAQAKAELSEYCEVLHSDPETLTKLDDKFAFSVAAQEIDLPVPDAHRISDPEQVLSFDFDGHDPPYILKSIAYDPIRRLDLTRLPQPDPEQDARVRHRAADQRGQPVDHAVVRRRAGVLHAQHRPRRSGPAALLL